MLYIGLNKRNLGSLTNKTATKLGDITIELDLMTVGSEFPSLSVQSSQINWLDSAVLSQIVKVEPSKSDVSHSEQIQDRYFHLKLTCHSEETDCLYAIPQVLQSRKMTFK